MLQALVGRRSPSVTSTRADVGELGRRLLAELAEALRHALERSSARGE